MNSFQKWIRRSGYALLILIAFLVAFTLVVNFLFRDQLIRYVVSQLNNQVDARINIQKVDFTLWKRFPNASVSFDHVFAQSSNSYKKRYSLAANDTLLTAEQIFLEFNLFKLIRGEYSLDNILIRNGCLNLKVTNDDFRNFQILKKDTVSVKQGKELKLKHLVLENMILKYSDSKSYVFINGLAEEFHLSGNFSESIAISVNTDFQLNYLQVNNEKYLSSVPIKLSADLFMNNSSLKISNGRICLRKMAFLVDGSMEGNKKIAFHVTGDNLDIADLLESLPASLQPVFDGFSGKGSANFKMSIAGPVNGTEIKADFSIMNGQIIQKSTGTKLKEINLDGSFKKNSNKFKNYPLFQLNRFSAVLGSGRISGKGLIGGQDVQKYKFDLSCSLNLKDIKEFLNMDTLDILSGNISGNCTSSGILSDNFNLENVKDLKIQGNASLKDVQVKFKKSNYLFENINGSIALDNDFYFQNISLKVNDNDFLLNGSLSGALPYMFNQTKDVTLKADVFSRHLDLSEYFVSENKGQTKGEYSRELLFPENLNLDVKVKVDEFKLNKFSAKNVSGYISYKPKIFVLKSLAFTSLSGNVSGNGVVLQDISKNFMVRGQVNISQLDIQQMFYSFNNFSQMIIQDRHLRGRVSGQIGFSSEWNNSLVLNQDKLLMDADLTISNGQLIKFEPLQGLSRFIPKEELQNVKFSTLKNKFLIKDKQIVIPQMDIESSAFTITASGIHKFDNHYEYKVKVLLSDVLWHGTKKKSDEFGEIEDDGLGKVSIPLSISGYQNSYKIKPDPKLLVSDVKNSFTRQKKELKSILNEEFGWFKKDSTIVGEKKTPKTKPHVSWDEDDTAPVQKTSVKTKSKGSEEKPKIKWE